MAARFNPIALKLPLSGKMERELNTLQVNTVEMLVSCPDCDAQYWLIAPRSFSEEDLRRCRRGLRDVMGDCSDHAPVVQVQ